MRAIYRDDKTGTLFLMGQSDFLFMSKLNAYTLVAKGNMLPGRRDSPTHPDRKVKHFRTIDGDVYQIFSDNSAALLPQE